MATSVTLFKSLKGPELRLWCDDSVAEEMGLTEIDELTYPVPGRENTQLEQYYIQFHNFSFATEHEEVVEYLRQNERYGIDFEEAEVTEDTPSWRRRLESYDEPEMWSPQTVKHFRDGGNVIRCDYECGYASTTQAAVTRHENNRCPNRPSESEEE